MGSVTLLRYPEVFVVFIYIFTNNLMWAAGAFVPVRSSRQYLSLAYITFDNIHIQFRVSLSLLKKLKVVCAIRHM